MHTYWIDIVGTCNLRCPSCPTGNFRESDFAQDAKPLGFMSFEKLSDVLEKINKEQLGQPTRIELYNWGEPLLHPRAAELIRLVKAYPNFRCGTSSNLSLAKIDLSAVVQAKPDWFRISLSGFTQNVYAMTHKRGDVELVKRNMRALRSAIDQSDFKLPVEVCYHLYSHNGGAELRAMAEFCESLGFLLRPVWAQFYPLEKLLSSRYSDADKKIISMLEISVEDLLAAAQPYRHESCRLQEQQTAINYDGSVQLCCATFDPTNIIAADFLETDLDTRQKAKCQSETCTKCISGGYHGMMAYRGIEQPKLTRAGQQVLA